MRGPINITELQGQLARAKIKCRDALCLA
ncbi:hypothetical protein B1R32_12310 [Abditibacterium utsteinense]|uniref:Uncharacterized protein n=1 Tax=Abditibacterium utsteinense TaxID=1960156 RepID=A0A2S8SPM2_9BACT|nr:hypothetical protein B1R32_12310 [Abditibacterium utsteinense]